MNQNHIKRLCQHFNLGDPIEEPQRVHGGLLHIMWRLNTDKGSFAIKQLSKDINLTDHRVIRNYELSENIASAFVALGIPAVNAIEKSDKHLFIINETGFLIYPWVNAKALDKDAVNASQALEIARILSKMHQIDVQFKEIDEAEFDIHKNDKIIALIDLAQKKNLAIASSLMESSVTILEINTNYHDAILMLNDHTVISHGDLDQKNVLWDCSKNPVLIDWESARKLNPTYEIVNAALDWSGITTQLDKNLFGKMIIAYKEAGGIIDINIVEAAFFGVLGNWINWMVYNIQRAANQHNPEQQKIGMEQVMQVLPTIIRLKSLMPELINVSKA
ncbi:TPA: phosphotransferase [Legionella pneumophila]|nr:phosphotransferase [Legionella pneumophila]HAU1653545.1 phosphotransferase [Legionella pneumophila]HDV6632479.1 phosphotransferase [Legionella pneumophila]